MPKERERRAQGTGASLLTICIETERLADFSPFTGRRCRQAEEGRRKISKVDAAPHPALQATFSPVNGGEGRIYFCQTKNCPPFAEIVEPVMKAAPSEARNTTQRAISSGSPSRPTGICGMMRSLTTVGSIALTISVAM
jgi:hypothetical protein